MKKTSNIVNHLRDHVPVYFIAFALFSMFLTLLIISSIQTARIDESNLSIEHYSVQPHFVGDTIQFDFLNSLVRRDLEYEIFNTDIIEYDQGILTAKNEGETLIVIRNVNTRQVSSVIVSITRPPQEDDNIDVLMPNEELNVSDEEFSDSSEVDEREETNSDSKVSDELGSAEELNETEGDMKEEGIESPFNDDKSFLVTIIDESQVTLASLSVVSGEALGQVNLVTPAGFVNYFEIGQTCVDPFNFETPITKSFTLIQGTLNQTSPCIELDEMAFFGVFKVGERITAHVSPGSANVEYRWFISDDNRDFFPLSMTGASIDIIPDYFRDYLAVNLIGVGDFQGVLKLGSPRIQLNAQTLQKLPSLLADVVFDGIQFIPLSTSEDLQAISLNTSHTFAEGTQYEYVTSGGLNKSYILVNSIDLADLGTLDNTLIPGTFTGTLDGNGYTISHLNVLNNSQDVNGLFDGIESAMIQNLIMQSFRIEAGGNVGSLAGLISGSTIEHVTANAVSLTSIASNGNQVGGLSVKIINSTLQSVSFTGDIISDAIDFITATERVGGIASMAKNVHVSQLNINANIEADQELVGGLFGIIESGLNTLSFIKGTVHISVIGGQVGGIAGQSYGTKVTNVSIGGIIALGNGNIGGIFGQAFNDTLISQTAVSMRIGKDTNNDAMGGLIGLSMSNLSIFSSENYGAIRGRKNVGGLVGKAEKSGAITILNSHNFGDIGLSTSDPNIGGLIGLLNSSATIDKVSNNGDISSGWQNVGGLIGKIRNEANSSTFGVIIQNSFNTGNVYMFDTTLTNDYKAAGGLIGQILLTSSAVTLTAVFNSGDVESTVKGDDYAIAGGMVGDMRDDVPVVIQYSYNIGTISTSQTFFGQKSGALIGMTNGTESIVDSYYLINSAIAQNNSAGESKTADELETLSTFATWSIDQNIEISTTWVLSYEGVDTFPWFPWQETPHPSQIPNN